MFSSNAPQIVKVGASPAGTASGNAMLSADLMTEGWSGRMSQEEGDHVRFEVGEGGPGAIVDFVADPKLDRAGWMYGEGIVRRRSRLRGHGRGPGYERATARARRRRRHFGSVPGSGARWLARATRRRSS
jgi:hypothetical protein